MCSFGLYCVWSCHILETSVRVERRSSKSASQRSGLNKNPEVILMPKSWLSVKNAKPKYLKYKHRDRVMEDKQWLYICARLNGNTLGPLPGE